MFEFALFKFAFSVFAFVFGCVCIFCLRGQACVGKEMKECLVLILGWVGGRLLRKCMDKLGKGRASKPFGPFRSFGPLRSFGYI